MPNVRKHITVQGFMEDKNKTNKNELYIKTGLFVCMNKLIQTINNNKKHNFFFEIISIHLFLLDDMQSSRTQLCETHILDQQKLIHRRLVRLLLRWIRSTTQSIWLPNFVTILYRRQVHRATTKYFLPLRFLCRRENE